MVLHSHASIHNAHVQLLGTGQTRIGAGKVSGVSCFAISGVLRILKSLQCALDSHKKLLKESFIDPRLRLVGLRSKESHLIDR
jgi:hypothetical protein